MKVSISKDVFKEFHPKLKVVLISMKGIDNQSKLEESQELLEEIKTARGIAKILTVRDIDFVAKKSQLIKTTLILRIK